MTTTKWTGRRGCGKTPNRKADFDETKVLFAHKELSYSFRATKAFGSLNLKTINSSFRLQLEFIYYNRQTIKIQLSPGLLEECIHQSFAPDSIAPSPFHQPHSFTPNPPTPNPFKNHPTASVKTKKSTFNVMDKGENTKYK